MTASTAKSTQVTNLQAVPRAVLTEAELGGALRVAIGKMTVATTNTDDVGDVIQMVQVPSRAKINKVEIMSTDLDAHATPTLAVDVGVYRADTGAVVDADAFASAITTLQAATTSLQDVTHESGATTIDEIGTTLWEIAGMTSDPGCDLIVALTVTTTAATGATGKIVMRVTWTT